MDSKELRLLGEAYASIQEGYGKKEEKEEKEEGCVPKSEKGEHNCAKKVCHEQFGEGQCIFGEHAEPDENGFVSHYDVLFGHGVEKNVPVSEMEVLFSESHGGHSKKKTMMAHYEVEGELVDEGMGLSLAASRIGGSLLSNPRTSAQQGAKNLQKNLTDPIGFAVKDAAKGAFKAVGDFVGSGMPNNRPQTPLQKDVAKRTQKVLNQDVDLFDIVKGHLMSEGYADTEEAALAIMANMSEEWRQSIVEGWIGQTADNVPETAGTVVGTVEKGVNTLKQKAQNVKGTFDYARDRARDGKSLRSPMTTKPTPAKKRSREFDKELPFGVNPGGPDFGR